MIKSHTDIEQSKKLAEFLTLESADMCWSKYDDGQMRIMPMELWDLIKDGLSCLEFTPAWSLAALFKALPLEAEIHKQTNGHKIYYYVESYMKRIENETYLSTERYENSVDACVAMIIKLHELNLL